MIELNNKNNRGKTPENAITPSELNFLAKKTIENQIGSIWLSGEVTDLYQANSGHAYFALKDASSSIKCTFFKQYNFNKVALKNGDNLLAFGKATLYEERGTFQLKVERIEKTGQGDMAKAFAELKVKLEALGYFAPDKKQKLPQVIQSLAIVTSKTSAAIKDVLNVIKRRNPLLDIKIYHASVQGDKAIEEIIDALLLADINQHDVILLTRGGGSIEDLWTFNDVSIAQTLFNLETPCVTAIGHERDTSIADLVADFSAITPSAAAELLTPDIAELKLRLSHDLIQLKQLINAKLNTFYQKIDNNYHQLEKLHPYNQIKIESQLIQASYLKLKQQIQFKIQQTQAKVSLQNNYFKHYNFNLREHKSTLKSTHNRIQQEINTIISRKKQQLNRSVSQLNTLSPLSTLSRGYSITLKYNDMKIINSYKQLSMGDEILTQLSDGKVISKVTKT